MKTIGYVVVCGTLTTWCESRKFNQEARGVLYAGGAVTMFASRRQAQAAIDRTLKYAALKGYDWRDNYGIRRVEQWVSP